MKTLVLVASVVCISVFAQAQDTLKVNLADAESRFLKNNLLLLAGQYNVDAQQALIAQARLWENPRFSAELNAYNADANRAFDVGKNGQKIFALEQVFYIGGKKKYEVDLAKQNKQIAQYEFQDLLRNLKFQLRKNFYSLHYDRITLGIYNNQLQLLQNIIGAYEEQSQKGNISLKEVLRLKAIYYQLNNEKTDLLLSISDAQGVLQTLLGTGEIIQPVVESNFTNNYKEKALNLQQLVADALANRPDFQRTKTELQSAETNVRLQKSLGVPDLTLGGVYDQQGSAFRNYVGLTMGMNLPLWNVNQGNIKAAKLNLKAVEALQQNSERTLEVEVKTAYEKALRIEEEYQTIDKTYSAEFELLNKGVIENFQKRNITLLEFTDFFESYNQSQSELNKLRKTRIAAYEELNAAVGKEIFNP
ncbi:MAG: TolC family protein [Chitinophagales bacterium]|nr:TolC family protein [Chitinophagales bacterium]